MNPDKKYQVTPDQRAQLLRRMMKEDSTMTYNNNVRVEGAFFAKLLRVTRRISLCKKFKFVNVRGFLLTTLLLFPPLLFKNACL